MPSDDPLSPFPLCSLDRLTSQWKAPGISSISASQIDYLRDVVGMESPSQIDFSGLANPTTRASQVKEVSHNV